VKLGVSQEQSKALVASSAPKAIAIVTNVNGQPAVKLEEGFDRAWRRVGLSLDRTGFTVEDRDRKQGIYYVRYISTTSENSEPGFFSKLFSSSDKDKAPTKYQISVRSAGDVSEVLVLNTNGQPETSPIAQRIVKVLAEDIK
jgi:outer membrane protein assembly factor BamC